MIVLLVVLVMLVMWWEWGMQIEGFSEQNTIVLMGDSVLNNQTYVPLGKSVEGQLTSRTSAHVLQLAEDNALIADVYKQIDKLPSSLDVPSTWIFISVGGNNLLRGHDETNTFQAWTILLQSLRVKMSNAHIVVFNVYLPANPQLASRKLSVDEWNKKVNAAGYPVIDVNAMLTSPSDFVYDIEPSVQGTNSIVSAILLFSM